MSKGGRFELEVMRSKRDLFADYRNPPHPLIQSHYFVLWANLDIYYAMNYLLSAFCSRFDEVAVVTLLKQLTVFSDRDHDDESNDFVYIIKVVWDAVFHREDLKIAVMHHSERNVASYSLRTLAIHHMNADHNILTTFFRLFYESMKAKQQITLATYSCVVRRLSWISKRFVAIKHKEMVITIWDEVNSRLKDKDDWDKWLGLMTQVCRKFGMVELIERI